MRACGHKSSLLTADSHLLLADKIGLDTGLDGMMQASDSADEIECSSDDDLASSFAQAATSSSAQRPLQNAKVCTKTILQDYTVPTFLCQCCCESNIPRCTPT